jgi:hypothetical protein
MPRRKPRIYLYPISLECIETEDNGGGDEVRMVIGARSFDLGTMNNTDIRNLEDDPGPIGFSRSLTVTLWDRDTGFFDSDDKLGEVTITADAPRDEEQVFDFTGDGAHYKFTYEIGNE